ncbi:trypco2 family protein [Actinoplanes sp. NPDC049596]|uniref:trypco2 family protein n=1 Tax=unclassified Actinoplanes TaxID=2626549 RepID=UPI003413FB42
MADQSDSIGLAEAIAALRDDLLIARAAGAGSDIQLPVESMTVELAVTATRSADGKAGFKVPLVPVELGAGGSRQRANEQRVTVVFGGPVDRTTGRPVKVASLDSRLKD